MLQSRALMVELPKNPSVLVLLVATDGARWLPDVLRGLRAQRYERMDVIAIDNLSTDGSGDILADALGPGRVVVLERRAGYGRALAAGVKVAAEEGLEVDAFLLIHDDSELAPGALDAMLTAMVSHDAGIVGAKLLEWSDPGMLQDIGQSSDRYGRIVPRVERGELDQGQHDGIHDVMFVTSAAMLIAREVVETVGLFDLRFVALRDDFDLCWRARLAGYRTIVVTDAIARHASAAVRGLRETLVAKRTRYFADRNAIATLIKNYGAARLALTLPVALGVSLLNALLYLVSGKRSASLQTLEALRWNITHLPSTLRARHRAQRARKVRDAEIGRLMHHGATRLRAQFERAVERVVGEVDEGVDEEARPRQHAGVLDRLRRHPTAALILIATVVGLLGARTMFFSGPLAGADLAPFPGTSGSFFTEFFSGWRGTGAGGAAPATPGLVILGAFSFLCFGSTWLAQRLLVLGLPVLGAVLMFRLVHALGFGTGARRAATVVYLASPLVLGSLGEGRFGDLVLLAAAPGLLLVLLRAAGILPGGWRAVGAGVAGLAATASLAPWALPFTAGVAVVIAVAFRNGRESFAPRVLVIIGGALALLFPWTFELLRPGSPIGAGGSGGAATMRALVGLSPGAVHPLPEAFWYGSAAVAFAALIVPASARARTTGLFATIAAAGLGFAWLVARGVPWIAPRPALPLIAAAIAVAVLAGAAFEGAGPLLSSRQFGAAHILAGIAGVLIVLQVSSGAVWIAAGNHPGIGSGGDLVPAFLASEAARNGEFRIAWIGGEVAKPVAALSGPGGRTMGSYLTRTAGSGQDELERAVAAIAAGSTSSAGRLLAPLGVRYVIVRPGATALNDAVRRQVDLRFRQQFRGQATVWLNEASISVATATSGSVRTSREDALIASFPGARGLLRNENAAYRGKAPKGTKTLLLAEDHSSRWQARSGGKTEPAQRSFEWASAFPATAGDVEVQWRGNFWHRAMLVIQVLIILLFTGEWSRRAARERGER